MNSLFQKYKDQIVIVLRSTILFAVIYLFVSYLREQIFSWRAVAFALLLGFMISLFLRVLFTALAKRASNESKPKS